MSTLATDRRDTHKYINQQIEGELSDSSACCPYGDRQIGKRCAWLAGFFDTHGFQPWTMARKRYLKNSKSNSVN